MLAYLAKSIVGAVVVLLVMSFIVFGLQSIIPADPARAIVGPNAPLETVEAMREQPLIGRLHLLLRHLQMEVGVLLREHAHSCRGERDHRGLEGRHPQQSAGLSLGPCELGFRRLQQSQHLLRPAGQSHPGVGEHDPSADRVLSNGHVKVCEEYSKQTEETVNRRRTGAVDFL